MHSIHKTGLIKPKEGKFCKPEAFACRVKKHLFFISFFLKILKKINVPTQNICCYMYIIWVMQFGSQMRPHVHIARSHLRSNLFANGLQNLLLTEQWANVTNTDRGKLLLISYKIVKGFLAITFLSLVISSWNFQDVCQRFLYS